MGALRRDAGSKPGAPLGASAGTPSALGHLASGSVALGTHQGTLESCHHTLSILATGARAEPLKQEADWLCPPCPSKIIPAPERQEPTGHAQPSGNQHREGTLLEGLGTSYCQLVSVTL